MVSVAGLRVGRRLGVLHGEGVVQTVLQRLVLGVVGRRCLALLPVAGDEARPYPVDAIETSSKQLSRRDTTDVEINLRVRVHLVVLGLGGVFSTTATKEQEEGGEQEEHGAAHHQSDQRRRGQRPSLGDVRGAD